MKIEETWNRQNTMEVEIELSLNHRKKSVNLVGQVLKRLKLERNTTYLAGPILIIFTLVSQLYSLSIVVGLYIAGLILYYNYLLRRIESVNVEDSVMDYLRHTLHVLRWFRLHYLILGLVSFLLGFALTAEVTEIAKLFTTKWLFIVIAAVIATPLITFYIHFEPHLKKIRKIVFGLRKSV